jgi:hypothetical protein
MSAKRTTKRTTKPEPPDIARMSAKLRASTCATLQLHPDKLSPGDEVLVSRVGSLKLLVSDMEAALLRGQSIDVAAYARASESLEAAVRSDRRSEGGVSTIGEEDARARMREILCQIDPGDGGIVVLSDQIDALELERDALRAEVAELRAVNDELRAELCARLEPPPAPQPQPSNVMPLTRATI